MKDMCFAFISYHYKVRGDLFLTTQVHSSLRNLRKFLKCFFF